MLIKQSVRRETEHCYTGHFILGGVRLRLALELPASMSRLAKGEHKEHWNKLEFTISRGQKILLLLEDERHFFLQSFMAAIHKLHHTPRLKGSEMKVLQMSRSRHVTLTAEIKEILGRRKFGCKLLK